MKPILVIAGESSGDIHGAKILKALKDRNPNLRFIGTGGVFMTPLLDTKLADISDLSVMGFVEVIRHIPRLMSIFKRILAAAIKEDIGCALFIDYPGFNMRMAKAIRKAMPTVRLHQFVCPQVWAWKSGRIHTLSKVLDTIYCLFDFEPKLFSNRPVEAIWVGNPIRETTVTEMSREDFFQFNKLDPTRPLVALLPGSRVEEICRLMPALVGLVEDWQVTKPNTIQWVIPVASNLPNITTLLNSYIKDNDIRLTYGLSHASQAYADAAVVCSGTAALETALLGTPLITIYKLNPLTYFLAKRFVKIPYFSLVNIIFAEKVVPELLQEEVNVDLLSRQLASILEPDTAAKMRMELSKLHSHLGPFGAAERVADHLIGHMIK